MTKSILTLSLVGLLAVAFVGTPSQLCAQTTSNAPAAKAKVVPFRGKLKSVDKTAKTFEVGTRTFQVTADTKLFKAGNTPAVLDDGVVGETVSGAYEKAADGKLIATKVTFGGKADAKEEAKPKEAPKP